MALNPRHQLLSLITGVALLVGIVLVVSADYTLAVAGIILIILSAIIFMVDVKVLLLDASDRARKW